jgi:hypothetical protein
MAAGRTRNNRCFSRASRLQSCEHINLLPLFLILYFLHISYYCLALTMIRLPERLCPADASADGPTRHPGVSHELSDSGDNYSLLPGNQRHLAAWSPRILSMAGRCELRSCCCFTWAFPRRRMRCAPSLFGACLAITSPVAIAWTAHVLANSCFSFSSEEGRRCGPGLANLPPTNRPILCRVPSCGRWFLYSSMVSASVQYLEYTPRSITPM